MIKLFKKSFLLFISILTIYTLGAEEVTTKEVSSMKIQEQNKKNSSNNKPLQAQKNDTTSSDSFAQYETSKLKTAKERLSIAKDMQESITSQDTLEGAIASLSTQMMQNKKMRTAQPVLITSFVRLDNFKKTSEFGRIVSESMINELSNRGFNIVDFRGQMGVSINEQGEYFITRDAAKLKPDTPNTYVVVGTYSRQYKKIMLNARVMDNTTGQIISTSRATYEHGLRDDCVIFKDCKPPRTIKIMKE